jgi:ribosomal protein S24E
MLLKLRINPKKTFIWNHDNPIENRKIINYEFYFSTNPILNKSEIKKRIRKIKES